MTSNQYSEEVVAILLCSFVPDMGKLSLIHRVAGGSIEGIDACMRHTPKLISSSDRILRAEF